MMDDPEETPLTIPEAVPTVATPVLLLSHVPPAGEPVSVVVAPAQTLAVPEIPVGRALTVNMNVVLQPVGKL